MSSREQQRRPEWAERERAGDLAWIVENWHLFWPAAQQGYTEQGRGALVVDITSRLASGHPFFFLAAAGIEQLKDPDALRMVRGYDPEAEFVTMMLKRERRVSTYRVLNPAAKGPPKRR